MACLSSAWEGQSGVNLYIYLAFFYFSITIIHNLSWPSCRASSLLSVHKSNLTVEEHCSPNAIALPARPHSLQIPYNNAKPTVFQSNAAYAQQMSSKIFITKWKTLTASILLCFRTMLQKTGSNSIFLNNLNLKRLF